MVYALSALLIVANLFVGYASLSSVYYQSFGSDVEQEQSVITKSLFPLTNSGSGIIEEENHDIYSPMPKILARLDLQRNMLTVNGSSYEEKAYEHHLDVIIPPPEF
ncbi:MAG: hypothetical protein ACK5IQ_09960 [Bacteroidales bacterium]